MGQQNQLAFPSTQQISEAVNHVAEALNAAWAFFHVLQGLHKGSRAHAAVMDEYGPLFDEVWRGLFNALFAAAGTAVDTRTDAISLFSITKAIRRHPEKGKELATLIAEIEAEIRAKGGLLEKMRNWRHKAVAHRAKESRDDSFYQHNKMSLKEIEQALTKLDRMLSRLARRSLGIHVLSTRGLSLNLAIQGESLFEAIAQALANKPE